MNNSFLQKLSISDADLMFKKCMRKIPIDKELYSKSQVFGYESQIGMLIPNGFTCIDVDTMPEAELLEKIITAKGIACVINNTCRGKHFIFKDTRKLVNQTAHQPNLLSIETDSRVPGKGYIILPEGVEISRILTQGEMQRRSYHYIPEGPLDEVPFWLIPDKDNKSLFKGTKFFGMKEGGRDDALFKFIMQCKDETNISYNDMIEVVLIINDFLFEKPLDYVKEISPKIKEEDFKKGRVKKNKQQMLVDIGKKIIKDKMVKKHKGRLYFFDGIKYKLFTPSQIKHTVIKEYYELLNTQDRNEIVNFIQDYVIEEREEDIIKLKNSVVTPDLIINIKDFTTSPNDGRVFVTNNINFGYNKNTPPEDNRFVDDYFNGLFPQQPEVVDLMYQMIGYCMLNYLPFRKSFYLYGPAGTGKSFIVNEILTRIFGEENISLTDPETIEKDLRMIRSLENKLILAVDEGEQYQTKKSGIFKKLVSGEPLEADVKGKDEIRRIKPSSTLIVTTNHLPSFADKSSGIADRLVIIDFKVRTKMIYDFINYFNQNHFEYIVTKAIDACHRILANGGFIIPQSIIERTSQVFEDDNNIIIFIKERFAANDNKPVDKSPVNALYEEYKVWCNGNRFQTLDKKTFNKNICEIYGMKIKQTTSSKEAIQRSLSRFCL